MRNVRFLSTPQAIPAMVKVGKLPEGHEDEERTLVLGGGGPPLRFFCFPPPQSRRRSASEAYKHVPPNREGAPEHDEARVGCETAVSPAPPSKESCCL